MTVIQKECETQRERNEPTKLAESKEKTKASYSFTGEKSPLPRKFNASKSVSSATARKVPKHSLQRYESGRKVEEETESDDTGVASFKVLCK